MTRRAASRRSHRTWNYVVYLPVRYRIEGEPRWYAGVTGDIGSCEAMIQSEWRPRPGTRVTMLVSVASPQGVRRLYRGARRLQERSRS